MLNPPGFKAARGAVAWGAVRTCKRSGCSRGVELEESCGPFAHVNTCYMSVRQSGVCPFGTPLEPPLAYTPLTGLLRHFFRALFGVHHFGVHQFGVRSLAPLSDPLHCYIAPSSV